MIGNRSAGALETRVVESRQMTSIYFAPYHSDPCKYLKGSTGQFATVEKAIASWPYDNGDDPSFYVALEKGGPLTWGVCRPKIRNRIKPGSIVVFFSFTTGEREVLYRLSAVATVADLIDRRAVYSDARFREHKKLYLNTMIKKVKRGWKYDESNRRRDAQHPEWLWLMSVRAEKKEAFQLKNKRIYETSQFDNDEGDELLAKNYIVFSMADDETYISPQPPKIAAAARNKCEHENWTDRELQRLTVEKSSEYSNIGRNYLRAANPAGCYLHREIRFDLPSKEASAWRQSLISVLKKRNRGDAQI